MRAILAIFFVIPLVATAQLPAFPYCQGWGCETQGGRNGTVMIVTDTADSGPGTLRNALESTGKRYIITQVDGVVRLQTPIKVTSGEVTLDLRRPPGGGLTITNKAIIFKNISNVVVLGARYRGTDTIAVHGPGAAAIDCIGLTSVQNAVVAFSSFYGWADEAVSIERAAANAPINKNITIQNNLFLEGCMVNCQAGEAHARPINLSRGWDSVSVHHNAFFGNERRMPQIAGCVNHPDCINTGWPEFPQAYFGYNLVAYWLEQATHIKNGGQADIIENVYIPGSSALSNSIEITDDSNLGTAVYVNKNTECDSATGPCIVASMDLYNGTQASASLTGLNILPQCSYPIRSPEWIKALGPDVWDIEDDRVLNQYLLGTIAIGGGYDPITYVPPMPVSGSVTDTDMDGVPDSFDGQPNTPDSWNDDNQNGWSNLEDYMNTRASGCFDLVNNFSDYYYPANIVQVYPNPATEEVFFRINSSSKNQTFTIQLFDVSGRQVFLKNSLPPSFSVSTSFFEKGAYVYKITQPQTGNLIAGKIIIE